MSTPTNVAAVAQSTSDDGLTIAEIIADLPTDPASIFVVLLLMASGALVLWAGRPRGKGGGVS